MVQYLITFTPVDSYRFSGETSFKPLYGKTDSFLQNDKYSGRRQSFRVLTETVPPQTTVMGAIRHYLLCDRSVRDPQQMAELIGEGSFDLARPQDQMGVIERISAVCLSGWREGKQVLCAPAPEDNQHGAADQGRYLPMIDDGQRHEVYNPKKAPRRGYFAFSLTGDVLHITQDYPIWQPDTAFFAKYDQPAFQKPKDGGQPKEGEGHYHLQQRCRLRDAVIEPRHAPQPNYVPAYLENPAFGVVVNLSEALIHPEQQRFLSLGAKESLFHVRAERCEIDLRKAVTPRLAHPMLRVALLSPARLPEAWRGDCVRALLTTRTVRAAVSDAGFRLQLTQQRYTYADTGSVFCFDGAEKRDAFIRELEKSNLRTCGFNQYISY
jgi:hypothetical protein